MSKARILRKELVYSFAILLSAVIFTGCGEKDGVIILPGKVKLEMVRVEAGTFEMSANDGLNSSNEVAHSVTLTKDFYIGRTEVTQAQWRAVMGRNPSEFTRDSLPVLNVSWNDAMAFCQRLNNSGRAPSGWKFTLPTETQWEYAARGGKNSKGCRYSGSNDIPSDVGWHSANSGGAPNSVREKKANELGLYDMSGNVWEWCLDDWNDDSSKQEAEFTRGNDIGGSERVIRGGAWNARDTCCRTTFRASTDPKDKNTGIGFRLALVPAQ